MKKKVRKPRELRSWFIRCDFLNGNYWEEFEGVSVEDAARNFMRDQISNYEEFEMNGSPERLRIEVKKSETAKIITNVEATPDIWVDFNYCVVKKPKVDNQGINA